MRIPSTLVTSLVTLALLHANTLRAQEGAHEAATDEAHYRYAIAGFIGATRVHGDNEFTLGIEGGVSLNREWSLGVVIERAERERDSTLVLAGVGWHPFGPGLRLQLGVGVKDPSGETETAFRAGLGWEKEIYGGWFVRPYVAYDVIRNEDNEGLFGVYVGKLF